MPAGPNVTQRAETSLGKARACRQHREIRLPHRFVVDQIRPHFHVSIRMPQRGRSTPETAGLITGKSCNSTPSLPQRPLLAIAPGNKRMASARPVEVVWVRSICPPFTPIEPGSKGCAARVSPRLTAWIHIRPCYPTRCPRGHSVQTGLHSKFPIQQSLLRARRLIQSQITGANRRRKSV